MMCIMKLINCTLSWYDWFYSATKIKDVQAIVVTVNMVPCVYASPYFDRLI